MKGIETGGGSGGTRRKRQPPRKASPKGPVGVRAPGPVGVFADPVPRAPSIAPRRAQTPAQRRQSEVRDTKGAADVARGRPASDRAITRARAKYSQVRDTKGDGLSEKDRQRVVAKSLTQLAQHVVKHQAGYDDSPSGGYTPGHPLVQNLKRLGLVDTFDGHLATGDALKAGTAGPVSAGVLKALDFTARPVHGIAGGADALVQGKGVGAAHHAATRGLEGKDRTLFSDVLKHAGAPKVVQGVGGFTLDVLADPTTYVTFGAAGVAARAAERAARQTAERAARAGVGEEAAKSASREAVYAAHKAGKSADEAYRLGRVAAKQAQDQAVGQMTARAAKRAAAAAPKGSGATVKFAGREVPGVRRGTAAAGRGAGAAARKVASAPGARRVAPRVQRAAAGARDLAREVRPTLAPAGADKAQFVGARQEARKARAQTNRGGQQAQDFARALQKRIGREHFDQVVKALEQDRVGSLPAHLQEPAIALRSKYRYASRLRRQAGLPEGVVGKGQGWLAKDDFKGIGDTAAAEERRGRRAVATAKTREARVQGRAELEVRQGDQRSVRSALAELDRNPGVHADADAAVSGFVEARKARSRAQHEWTAANKKWRNAHNRPEDRVIPGPARGAARPMYSDSERAHAQERLHNAREGLDAAKAHFDHAAEQLRTVAEKHAGRKAARKSASPLRNLDRQKPGTLKRLEDRRAKVMAAEARTAAARKVPRMDLARGETQDQYLRRVIEYAHGNGLTLLERKARGLLARKPTGVAKGYHPHAQDQALREGLGLVDGVTPAARGGRGRTVQKTGSSRRRGDKRRVDVQNPERVAQGKEPFSTDVPLVAVNYLSETSRKVAQAEMVRGLASHGRRVKAGDPLRPGEELFHLGVRGGRFGLHPVKEIDDHAGGQYVALNAKVVEDAFTASRPARSTKTSARMFDRVQGTWKRVATATPGFHVRNAVGDTQMAYLEQPGHLLPRNVAQAGRAVRRVSQMEREAKRARPGKSASKKTIKVAGKRQPVDEFLAGAQKQGVIRSGYVGRELEDLTGAGPGAARKVGRGTGDRLKRWMQNREDLFRLSTYKHGLDRGMSEGEAADLAMEIHIDYGDLTETERKYLRRAMPFYTFTGRALPLHVKKLVTNPGKFANIEKAREEIGKSTGLSEDEQRSRMQEYQQRQAPFVIKIGSGPQAISAALPLTMLNEIPTSTSLGDYLGELSKFTAGLLSPTIKIPAELYSNQSFFFRGKAIEDPNRPLVAAPSWVKHVPKKYWDELGITPDYVDKRTGKKTWGWRGKADYAVKNIPGPFNVANQLLSGGTNRRGQGETAKVVAGVSGVRIDPLDEQAAAGAQVSKLYEQLAGLNRRAGALNQQGVNAKMPTPEYFRLRTQIKVLEGELDRARAGADGAPAPAGPVLDPQALARARALAARSTGSPEATARALARARAAAGSR